MDKPIKATRLLSTDEAALYLGVSRRKLESWVASGFCPVVRLDGTVRRFDRDALDALVDASARKTGMAR